MPPQQLIVRPVQELFDRHLPFPGSELGLLNWRTYNSPSATAGELGQGWTTSFNSRPEASPGQRLLHHTAGPVTLFDDDGRVLPPGAVIDSQSAKAADLGRQRPRRQARHPGKDQAQAPAHHPQTGSGRFGMNLELFSKIFIEFRSGLRVRNGGFPLDIGHTEQLRCFRSIRSTTGRRARHLRLCTRAGQPRPALSARPGRGECPRLPAPCEQARLSITPFTAST